jgi:hypothetical protein
MENPLRKAKKSNLELTSWLEHLNPLFSIITGIY